VKKLRGFTQYYIREFITWDIPHRVHPAPCAPLTETLIINHHKDITSWPLTKCTVRGEIMGGVIQQRRQIKELSFRPPPSRAPAPLSNFVRFVTVLNTPSPVHGRPDHIVNKYQISKESETQEIWEGGGGVSSKSKLRNFAFVDILFMADPFAVVGLHILFKLPHPL